MNPDIASGAGEVVSQHASGSLIRNVSVSSASYAAMLIGSFALLPVMIQFLGVQRYGLWMLAVEVTSYFGNLDLGIRTAVTYYIAHYLARGSSRQLNEVASTALWSVSLMAAILAAAGWLLAWIYPMLFDMRGQDIPEIQTAVILLMLSMAIGLPVEVLNSTLNGHRRIDIGIGIDTGSRVAGFIAMFVALTMGYGLVVLGIIQVAGRLLCLIADWIAIRRIAPGLSFNPFKYANYTCLKSLTRFGIPSLMINLGRLVTSRADLIMVGMILGPRAAGLYSIPKNLMEYASGGVIAISAACSAHFTQLYASQRTGELLKLYAKVARIIGVGVCLLAAWMATFGHDFLSLWQGPAFVSGVWTQRADIALIILVIAFLPRMLASMTIQLFLATGRLSFVVWTNGFEAITKIALSIWLIRGWGLAGAAIANLIPLAVFEGVAAAGYLFRSFPVEPRSFFINIVTRPLIAGILACAASVALIALRPPSAWFTFLAEAALAAMVGLAGAFIIGFNGDERRTVLGYIRNFRKGS